jgi:hypothetical protein
MSSMSLWNIEQGLADLFEQREELLTNPPPIETLGDDQQTAYAVMLTEVDLAIAEYIKAEVKKVDGVRGWWKHLEMIRDAAKAEAKAMQDRAQVFDRQLTVLKNAIQITLEEMEWRAGKPRKLEGKIGSISLKGNGGRQPVVITDEALIPNEFQLVTMTISADAYERVLPMLIKMDAAPMTPRWSPNLTAIGNALAEPCKTCNATGVLFSANTECTEKCTSCGGSGKNGVPGATLAPRGAHVEIK